MIRFSKVRSLVVAVLTLGFVISFSSESHGESSVEKREMPYYVCYGISNIKNHSSEGIMGVSTTICDRTTMFKPQLNAASGTLTRNGVGVESYGVTWRGVDKSEIQLWNKNAIVRTGNYKSRSRHEVVSGWNNNHSLYWHSEESRTF